MRRPDGTHIPAEAWAELLPRACSTIDPCVVLRPSIPLGPRTVAVIGTYRSGTSFVAEILMQLGVHMGDAFVETVPRADYECYEDAEMHDALKDVMSRNKHHAQCNEWRYVQQVISEHDAKHDVWGFKYPGSVFVIDRLLGMLRNPHLIVVVRDPIATWQSDWAHGGQMAWPVVRNHMACVLDMIEKPRAPTLAISYERAKDQKSAVADAIKSFLKV